jgi:hypothetical protein
VTQHRRHVVLYAHNRPGALARARTIVPLLGSRATVVVLAGTPGVHRSRPGLVVLDPPDDDDWTSDTALHALSEYLRAVPADLVVVDGGLDPWRTAATLPIPVVAVRRPVWLDGEPAAGRPEPVAWLAPFPGALDAGGAPAQVAERTLFAGFVSPCTGTRMSRGAARRRLGLDPQGRHVTVVAGRGGVVPDAASMAEASRSTPVWTFSVLGCQGSDDDPPAAPGRDGRMHVEQWCERMVLHLTAADAVIGGGSLSLLADVAAVRRPYAIVPRATPGDEERWLAAKLERLNAAVVLPSWPPAFAWPALLADVLDAPTRPLQRLADGRGPRRAASWLDQWASAPPAVPTVEAPVADAPDAAAADERDPALADAPDATVADEHDAPAPHGPSVPSPT